MRKILVVEDTLAIRDEVCDILKMEGYAVFQAENGKIGVEVALKEQPDLIISDILMPELDGFEMFKTLQKHKKTASIPLIFLSAKGEKENIRNGMNLGAEDYLTKPINVNDLVNAVQNKIKKKLSIDQNMIDRTAALTNVLESQKKQLDAFNHLISDELKPVQIDVVELLTWTQKELEGTNSFETSNKNITEKWGKLEHSEDAIINTNSIALAVLNKINRPAHISITIQNELPKLLANEKMLEKVFEILIQKAVHFIDKKIGRVELGFETKENEYVFSVTYDYLRINTAYPSETYDSFNLIESSASIGVGLNIAKKIISYYGGKLYKKTVPNKETIFSFNFPKTNTYA